MCFQASVIYLHNWKWETDLPPLIVLPAKGGLSGMSGKDSSERKS